MRDDLQVLIESLCWLGHLQPYEKAMDLNDYGWIWIFEELQNNYKILTEEWKTILACCQLKVKAKVKKALGINLQELQIYWIIRWSPR